MLRLFKRFWRWLWAPKKPRILRDPTDGQDVPPGSVVRVELIGKARDGYVQGNITDPNDPRHPNK